MKRSSMVSALEGTLLAFCVCFAGCGCMVSGFSLGTDLFLLAGCLFLISLFFSCLFALRGKYTWIFALATALLALWHWKALAQGLAAVLDHLLAVYDLAYGWGISLAGQEQRGEAQLFIGLFLIGSLNALAAAWAAAGKGWTILAVFAGALPLAACLVVTDTVPEPLWLGLLLLGLTLLLMTRLVRKTRPEQAGKLTALLALPLAAAIALLFWAVPKDTYAGQNYPEKFVKEVTAWFQDGNLQSLPEQIWEVFVPQDVNLALVGNQYASQRPVMEVTAAQNGVLYLRGRAYAGYDGKSWAPDEGEWVDSDFPLGEAMGTVEISTRRLHDVLYFPYNPGDFSVPYAATQAGIRNEDNHRRYTVAQYAPNSAGDAELTAAQQEKYLALPEETRFRASEILADMEIPDISLFFSYMSSLLLVQGEQELFAAQKIAEFVRQSASYDLDTPRMPGNAEDFALWFLEESDTGFCVHFASATVVLLRAAGIPARYVTGYLVVAEAGKPVTVLERSAHAWTEAYIGGIGWVPLEATPAEVLSFAEETQATEGPKETQAPTAPPESASQPQASASGTEQSEPSPSRPQGLLPGEREGQSGARFTIPGWVWWLLCLVLITLGQWRLRLYWRKRQFSLGSPNGQALARWREVVRLSRLTGHKPDRELLEIAQKAKYSQHTISPEELALLDNGLRQSIQALSQKPWALVYRILFAAW